MRDKKWLQKIIFNPKFFTLVGFIILGLIIMPLYRNFSQRYSIGQEIRDLEQEVVTLESKNQRLGGMIKYLESDAFVEEQARLNLGLKKQGEKVVVVEGEQMSTPIETQASNTIYRIPGLEKSSAIVINNPQRWVKYFFK